MASGDISMDSPKAWIGRIHWSSSLNKWSNSSTITVTVYTEKTDGWATSGGSGFNGTISIGSNFSRTFSYSQEEKEGETNRGSWTTTIDHNYNGTGSVYISCSINKPWGTTLGGQTLSGEGTAVFDSVTFTVDYRGGDGSGTNPRQITVARNESITLRDNFYTAPSPSHGEIELTYVDKARTPEHKYDTKTTSGRKQTTTPKVFSGWSDGYYVYGAGNSYTVDSDVTFTAQWKNGNTTYPTFQLPDPSYTPYEQVQFSATCENEKTKPQIVNQTQEVSLNLDGWDENAKTQELPNYVGGASYNTFRKNTTLYTIWSYTYTLAKEIEFPKTTDTKPGYAFVGWKNDNETKIYKPGETREISDNMTFKAVWKPQGAVDIRYKGQWRMGQPYIYHNNRWRMAIPEVYDGKGWKIST